MKRTKQLKKRLALVLSAALLLTACLSGCGSKAGAGGEEQLLDKVLREGKLVVVLNIGNAPWTYKDDATGEYTGMAVELIEEYCRQLNVTCEIQPMAFESLIPSITSGKADIICTNLSRTVARSTSVMFTDAIGSDYGVVICKKGAYAGLDEVNRSEVTLTTESGSVWESVAADVLPDAVMNTVDTTPNAFAAVQAGRADCMVTDLAIAEQLVASDDSMEILSEYCYTDTMAFAVDNSYLCSTFLASFDSYMKNIKSNGTYNEIYKQYFDTDWVPVFTESGV